MLFSANFFNLLSLSTLAPVSKFLLWKKSFIIGNIEYWIKNTRHIYTTYIISIQQIAVNVLKIKSKLQISSVIGDDVVFVFVMRAGVNSGLVWTSSRFCGFIGCVFDVPGSFSIFFIEASSNWLKQKVLNICTLQDWWYI